MVFGQLNNVPGRTDLTVYAGRGMGLRCRCDFGDLSAVRFVYRYMIYLKAQFRIISPNLLKPAPR
jgi:hypothetical protein